MASERNAPTPEAPGGTKMAELENMPTKDPGDALVTNPACAVAQPPPVTMNTQERNTHMKEDQGSKERGTASPVSEMTEAAMKNCEQALRTGLKLQEEAAKYWTNLLNQTATVQDMQKKFSNAASVATGAFPLAQERFEEMLELVEKNGRTSAELMKKAVEAAQTPVIADSQSKWMDCVSASVAAARSNAEALTQISTEAIDSWIEFARKNTEVTEIRLPKAA